MNNSELFSKAHAMTRASIKAGDSYQVTFGACLKAIKAQQANKHKVNVIKVVASALNTFAFMMVITFSLVLVGLVFGGIVGFTAIGGIVGGIVGLIFTAMFVVDDIQLTMMAS